MKKKYIFILSAVLLAFVSSIYIYKNKSNSDINQQENIYINKNFSNYSEIITGRSMPDECLSNDFPECYSRNYNEVEGNANSICDCEVVFNDKTYTEHFDINIHIEYKELIGGQKRFSETEYFEYIFNNYCDFVCHEFGEQIKDGTYIESK